MMERGLRGKVAALGAAVVLCAGGSLLGSSPQDTAAVVPVPAAAPSIYAQQGKCRNHAAFSTLKTIKHPL